MTRLTRRRLPATLGDDYLVAPAVAAGADALVSGDRDLADLTDVGVTVLTPRALVEHLDAPSS
jgi:predicted nucleic acid-binding protein